MAKGTRFGRQAQEAAWQSAEVDALYRLAAAGVRVPRPYNFHDGVLLMELVTDADGDAAPRLNDVAFTRRRGARAPRDADRARWCACCAPASSTATCPSSTCCSAADGPVIIDLPQAVDAAGNNHAPAHAAARRRQPARLLRPLRAGAAGHRLRPRDLGAVRSAALLQPDTRADRPLRARAPARSTWAACMREIDDARAEEAARRLRMQGAR